MKEGWRVVLMMMWKPPYPIVEDSSPSPPL